MTARLRPPDGRAVLSLDGTWEFRTEDGRPCRIAVPGPWQAFFDDLRNYTGTAWYRRVIRIPPEWEGRRVRLYFGAADERAVVRVNGTEAGDHEGGYLPFAFEVQDLVSPGGTAILEVEVEDRTGPDIPMGKQSWYGPLGGIWQSVRMEAVGDAYVTSMKVEANPVTGAVCVRPRLGGDPDGVTSRLQVTGPGGVIHRADGEALTVPDPVRWNLDAPALYTAQISLVRGGEVLDATEATFGFRTVEGHDGAIWLNGQRLYLTGALDQDYYPGGICTPPSDEFLRDQVRLAKSMGLNCLRCHIKIPDPRYLDWADRLGILVWEEVPSWGELTQEARRRVRETLAGMVERDGNHPSLIAWTIGNESWGLDLGDPDQRDFLRETVALARELDPTRMVVDNSACAGNFHLDSDLNDFHWYASIPDHVPKWNDFLDRWTADPSSTWSPHGDAIRKGDEPIVMSEFGNWGLPDPAGLREPDGSDPWWFRMGAGRGGDSVMPEGAEERAAVWGLPDAFGSPHALFASSQQHQFEALRYEVETMRLRPGIAGFVVTEWTDLYWECNGLVDLNRNPKAGHDGYRWLFAPDLPVPVPERRRCAVGERVGVEVVVAHASDRDLSRCRVRWRFGGCGGELVADVALWSATPAGRIELAPEEPGRYVLELELLDAAGETAGRNAMELAVFPGRDAPTAGPAVWAEESEVAAFLEAAGYRLDREAVVSVGTEAGQGPRLILPRPDVVKEIEGHRVVPRSGSVWEGDWVQGLHWLTPPLRRDTPLNARLDLTCEGLVPAAIVDGCDPSQVLAGMFVGWVRNATATAARLRPGLVVATFPLLSAGGPDPMTVALLRNLLREVSA